jgi:hypothetical protein
MPVNQTFNTVAALKQYITDRITVNNNREIDGQEMLNILQGVADFLSPKLQQELIVQLGAGGAVGGALTGDDLLVGMTLEDILRKILIKAIHPTYLVPTLQLTSSDNVYEREIGTIISPIFNSIFTQNDGGALVTRALNKNGTQISSAFPFTDNNITLSGVILNYQAAANYAQGPIKNNNIGTPDAVGRIEAGLAQSNVITYAGYRKMFYGFPVTTPADSASIRGLIGNKLKPLVGDLVQIAVPAGATKVVFAYPDTLEDPQSVTYQEAGYDVKEVFTKTNVNVEGANAFAAVGYKVFTYTPVEAFPTACTYIVKI